MDPVMIVYPVMINLWRDSESDRRQKQTSLYTKGIGKKYGLSY